MELTPIYYATPVLDNELDCWRMLAKFMADETQHRMIFMRAAPVVEHDWDIREQVTKYRGFVRVHVSNEVLPDAGIPSIGQA